MPSLEIYKKMFGGSTTSGALRKYQSDMIMESTFTNDIAYKQAYIYDYYHDDEPLIYKGNHPQFSKTKFPIDIKFIQVSYNSENKDVVGYHIQFRPSFDWRFERKLSYYNDYMDKFDSEFPIGLFIDVWDDNAHYYRKWLITEPGYNLGLQFPTWYILPCDYLFQWIYNGVKYQHCGVSRSQSSYKL